MKAIRIAAPIALLVLVGGTALGLNAARQVDGGLTFDQLPPAVRQAFTTIAGGAPATEIERLSGGTVAAYEIEYQRDGAESGVVVTELGDVIEVETAVTAADLPGAVRAGIERAFPGAVISEADSVQISFFEVEFVQDGKAREVRVSPTGRVAQSNDDGESEDDGESADEGDSKDGGDDKSEDEDDAESADDGDDDGSGEPGEK